MTQNIKIVSEELNSVETAIFKRGLRKRWCTPKKITKCCLEENIDPIAFNQGAWFISAKLNELCAFQRIPEDKRELDKITELT